MTDYTTGPIDIDQIEREARRLRAEAARSMFVALFAWIRGAGRISNAKTA